MRQNPDELLISNYYPRPRTNRSHYSPTMTHRETILQQLDWHLMRAARHKQHIMPAASAISCRKLRKQCRSAPSNYKHNSHRGFLIT